MKQDRKCKLFVKNTFFGLSLTVAVLLLTTSVHAQSDPARGSWGISTNGMAQLDRPSSGDCKASGSVLASFYDSFMDLSGGSITIHNLGISIGATNCTSPNFQGTGSYKVTETGDGNFQVDGTFTTQFVGRPAACSGTALNNVAFSIAAKIGSKTGTVTITGLDSGTYAEGPPPGPLSCTAPILNLTGTGTGTKF